MTLDEDINRFENNLKKKVFHHIKNDDLISVAQVLIDNHKQVISFTEEYIPQKAIPMLKAKFDTGWDGSMGGIDYEQIKKKQEFFKKKFQFEKNLVEAKHPRRVEKLFKESLPLLEKMYHRSFSSREDLAVMNALYKRVELIQRSASWVEEYSEERTLIDNIDSWTPEMKDVAREIYTMPVQSITEQLFEETFGLFKDLNKPHRLVYYKDNELTTNNHSIRQTFDEKTTDKLGTFFKESWLGGWSYRNVVGVLMRGMREELSFEEAATIAEHRSAERFEMKPSSRVICMHLSEAYFEWPKYVEELVFPTLKKFYEERETNKEVQKFLKKISTYCLQRWEATAIDYEKIFQFHRLDSQDEWYISFFYEIKKGMKYPGINEIREGRLPMVLTDMVTDGIIKQTDIQPPLKNNYLKSHEVFTHPSKKGKALPGGKSVTELMNKEEPKGIYKITGESLKALPAPQAIITTNIQGLEQLLDLKQPHEYIGRGKYSLFFAQVSDGGGIEKVYKLSILKDDEKVKKGVEIILADERLNVKREKENLIRDQLIENYFDSRKEDIIPGAHTVLIDMPTQQFISDHFQDFILHTFIHYEHITVNVLRDIMKKITNEHALGLQAKLDYFEKVHFNTFELEGKFGFTVRKNDEFTMEQVDFVMYTLKNYLDDAGINYYYDIDSDEYSRYQFDRKIKANKFRKNHLEEVCTELQQDGLFRVLSYLLTSDKYSKSGFYTNTCETCDQAYIGGSVEPKTRNSSLKITSFDDLHYLANHPGTFVHDVHGNLERVYDIIQESKDHIPFIVFEQALSQDIMRYAQVYEEYLTASSKSFNFWEDNCGSIHAEPEELEEDPELKKLYEKEIQINKNKNLAEQKLNDSLITLQRKYEAITGSEKKESIHNIKNFWSEQLYLYNIYRTTKPKLLTEKTIDNIAEIPINFFRM